MIKHDEVVDKTIAEINGKPFFVYRGIEEGWQPIKSFRAEFWEELSTPRWLFYIVTIGFLAAVVLQIVPMFESSRVSWWCWLLYFAGVVGTVVQVALRRRRWRRFFNQY